MMYGFVASRGGTFGRVSRCYVTEDGVPMVVIAWGPLRWLTAVSESDCRRLTSPDESGRRTEAEEWLSGRP